MGWENGQEEQIHATVCCKNASALGVIW